MPPKLRKEKSTSGSKSETSNTNMFDILADDTKKQNLAKITHDTSTTMATHQQAASPTRLDSMQNDIKSMVSIINALSHSFHKMDKLDHIESRQKSSEEKITGMITDLRSEFETLKANTTTPPTYADILKTTRKQNKNMSANPSTAPLLQILEPQQAPTQLIPLNIPIPGTLSTTNQSSYSAPPTTESLPPHTLSTNKTSTDTNVITNQNVDDPTNTNHTSTMATSLPQPAPPLDKEQDTTGLNQTYTLYHFNFP